MKKLQPVLTLFFALVAPLLILVFLSSGKHNKESLAYDGPRIANPDGSSDSLYKTLGGFSFTAQDGSVLEREDLNGSIFVGSVFFTEGLKMTSRMMENLAEVQEYFEDVEEVKLLTLTVDPERDTPGHLQGYAHSIGAQEGKWYLLSGTKPDLYGFSKQELGLVAEEDSNSTAGFNHDYKVRLFDKEGKRRGRAYDLSRQAEADTLIDHIKLLQFEYAETE